MKPIYCNCTLDVEALIVLFMTHATLLLKSLDKIIFPPFEAIAWFQSSFTFPSYIQIITRMNTYIDFQIFSVQRKDASSSFQGCCLVTCLLIEYLFLTFV